MHLRDALLASLANLPGSREFHLHVLVSSPRKHSNLYPFASQPRLRTYLQDILILLSEQASPDARRLFVSAIEASVYHIPSTSSAIVYVSKVDSTGQATSTITNLYSRPRLSVSTTLIPQPRPLPVDHLWVHLFARTVSTRLYYLLPGLGELEASHSLENACASSSSSVTWIYGHPYSQTDVPLPGIIPWFDDDPKARFIDDIAYTTEVDGVKSPERKRPRIIERSGSRVDKPKVVDKKDVHSQKEEQTTKVLRKVSVSEFWERMSFRQECISGAVTGFFVMAVSQGQVAPQLIKRVLSSLMTGHEFPSVERAAWSTKVLEESIRGLCDAGSGRTTPEPTLTCATTPQTPPPRLIRLKHPIVDASPNPFPEPMTSLETYNAYISRFTYSSTTPGYHGGDDGKVKVTVLTVRRKKRAKP
ncbi:histone acetylation protein-domain-containing protein [Pisolithus tinctorius]|nr:histone acetylation protein-domain-containing protein [Pisolithus tinctorius]